MYYIVRIVPLAVLVILLATAASAEVAEFTAEQAMSYNMQLFLTGLAGVVTAAAGGYAAVILLSVVTRRD